MERRYINALVAIAIGSAILVGVFIYLGPGDESHMPSTTTTDYHPDSTIR